MKKLGFVTFSVIFFPYVVNAQTVLISTNRIDAPSGSFSTLGVGMNSSTGLNGPALQVTGQTNFYGNVWVGNSFSSGEIKSSEGIISLKGFYLVDNNPGNEIPAPNPDGYFLEKVSKLKVKKYSTHNFGELTERLGLDKFSVENTLPDAVLHRGTYTAHDESQIIALLTAALQEEISVRKALEERIKILEKNN